MLIKLIVEILFGALAGWIAGKFMKTENTFWMNVLLGLVGGIVGGFLGNLLGVGGGGWLSGLVLAVGGACLLIWVVRKLK